MDLSERVTFLSSPLHEGACINAGYLAACVVSIQPPARGGIAIMHKYYLYACALCSNNGLNVKRCSYIERKIPIKRAETSCIDKQRFFDLQILFYVYLRFSQKKGVVISNLNLLPHTYHFDFTLHRLSTLIDAN